MRLILDGDVSAALLAVSDNSPVDILWGIGGTPEGVISAAAIKCIGGEIKGRLWPRNDEERQAAIDAGYDLAQVLSCDDLVRGDDVFFSATGVTDGDVLQGVRYQGDRRRHDRVAGDALALGHRPARVGAARPDQAARAHRRPVRLVRGTCARARGPGRPRRGRPAAGTAKRPTLDSARSSCASERRNAWVTSTWIADWVTSYTGTLKPAAIAG